MNRLCLLLAAALGLAGCGEDGPKGPAFEDVRRVVVVSDSAALGGLWDERYGALRDLNEYDAGLRIISGYRDRPTASSTG